MSMIYLIGFVAALCFAAINYFLARAINKSAMPHLNKPLRFIVKTISIIALGAIMIIGVFVLPELQKSMISSIPDNAILIGSTYYLLPLISGSLLLGFMVFMFGCSIGEKPTDNTSNNSRVSTKFNTIVAFVSVLLLTWGIGHYSYATPEKVTFVPFFSISEVSFGYDEITDMYLMSSKSRGAVSYTLHVVFTDGHKLAVGLKNKGARVIMEKTGYQSGLSTLDSID